MNCTKTLIFQRAPMRDSVESVVSYLAERGCSSPEVHRGVDGSFRGSGVSRALRIPLSHGQSALIDEELAELTSFKWRAKWKEGSRTFYAYRDTRRKGRPGRQMNLLHRVIMSTVLGRPLAVGELVDHVNHDTLDNRACNLRVASTSTSSFNRRRQMNNVSGFKGVVEVKNGRFRAKITVAGKHHSIGQFGTAEEAARAYDEAALRLHGEFACINGPDGSFRGSGTRTSIEDMAAYEVIEDGEEP